MSNHSSVSIVPTVPWLANDTTVVCELTMPASHAPSSSSAEPPWRASGVEDAGTPRVGLERRLPLAPPERDRVARAGEWGCWFGDGATASGALAAFDVVATDGDAVTLAAEEEDDAPLALFAA